MKLTLGHDHSLQRVGVTIFPNGRVGRSTALSVRAVQEDSMALSMCGVLDVTGVREGELTGKGGGVHFSDAEKPIKDGKSSDVSTGGSGRVGRMAAKRSRSYAEDDEDDRQENGGDSDGSFNADEEYGDTHKLQTASGGQKKRLTSSSSASASSRSFSFPTKSPSADPFHITDRWLALDTSSFSTSNIGLQAMVLISSLA